VLHPDLMVVAWVCDNGKTILDWRPGPPRSAAE
jgi:hypothetical protein